MDWIDEQLARLDKLDSITASIMDLSTCRGGAKHDRNSELLEKQLEEL